MLYACDVNKYMKNKDITFRCCDGQIALKVVIKYVHL